MPDQQCSLSVCGRQHDNRAGALMRHLWPRRQRHRSASSISFHNPHMWPSSLPGIADARRQEARSFSAWSERADDSRSDDDSAERWSGFHRRRWRQGKAAGWALCNYRRSSGACPDWQLQSFLLFLPLLSRRRTFYFYLHPRKLTAQGITVASPAFMYCYNVRVISSYIYMYCCRLLQNVVQHYSDA